MPGQGEYAGKSQDDCGGKGFWVVTTFIWDGESPVAKFKDAPVHAGKDCEVDTSENLILEFGAVTRRSPLVIQTSQASRCLHVRVQRDDVQV